MIHTDNTLRKLIEGALADPRNRHMQAALADYCERQEYYQQARILRETKNAIPLLLEIAGNIMQVAGQAMAELCRTLQKLKPN